MRIFVVFLASMLVMSGCTGFLAEQAVRAPNQGWFAGSHAELTAKEMHELFVDQQLHVPVGPPNANLSVWICEPISGVNETLLFHGSGRRMRLEIQRKPPREHAAASTQPATQPTTQPITTSSTQPAVRGTIFILHGIQDDQSLGPYMLYRELLTHGGYRVVQVDLRGHGRSTGDWITFGAVESRDLVQVLDSLDAAGLITGKVGVVSISYGAAIAIQWAAIDPRIKAIVAIEPFTSVREVARDSAGFVLGPGKFLFSKEDIQKAVDRAGELASFNPDDVNPLVSITKTQAQVLIIHSKSDEFIPWQHSQRLHDAAADHSKLILVNGDTHFDIWLKSLELIRVASLRWFEKHLAADINPEELATDKNR